uniref:Putative phosphate acyltransferase n=1 Tax=Triatoma infestans TaxID=30076 RepID=A0A023F8I1_TRIIF
MRLTYQAGGMSVVVKGKQASRKEAPILVIAPHSTFLDAVIVYVTGFPSIIVRTESGNNPWLGKIINYTQPIYVRREDHDSRAKTIQDIITRVNSEQDWSQVLIFPEGTCTNRSCLITFKAGAFYPGVPIQPVLIRYPNKLDTVTWTWEGPGVLKLMWLTLVQPQSTCEIEFLPVYKPTAAEQSDPKLYAHNVRQLMAKTLGIPTLDYTYADCKLVSRAKKLNYSQTLPLLQAHQLRVKLGLSRTNIEDKLVLENPQLLKGPGKMISYMEFAKLMGVSHKDPLLEDLFYLYDKAGSGLMDLKEYLLSVVLVNRSETKLDMIKIGFEVCGGRLNIHDFTLVLRLVLVLGKEEVDRIFAHIDTSAKGKITYFQFEDYAKNRPEFSIIYGSVLRRLSLPRDNDETKTK